MRTDAATFARSQYVYAFAAWLEPGALYFVFIVSALSVSATVISGIVLVFIRPLEEAVSASAAAVT